MRLSTLGKLLIIAFLSMNSLILAYSFDDSLIAPRDHSRRMSEGLRGTEKGRLNVPGRSDARAAARGYEAGAVQGSGGGGGYSYPYPYQTYPNQQQPQVNVNVTPK